MPDPTAPAAAAAVPAAAAPPPHYSSDAAIALIVNEEDGDKAYYERHYQHFDWPAGASGPTVGVGYDLGYATHDEVERDWGGILPDAMIAVMQRGVGLRGAEAHAFVVAHRDAVTVTWDQGLKEFTTRELPKWEARIDATLPNARLMPPDCYGAIVSIGYNRGTGGFVDPSPRDAEMRAIRALVAAKRFDAIPAEILAMRRLWPAGGDLWRRRGHEAALFVQGLKAAAPDSVDKALDDLTNNPPAPIIKDEPKG
jgi:hypothetical protein